MVTYSWGGVTFCALYSDGDFQDKYCLPDVDACSQHWNKKFIAALQFLQLVAIETNAKVTLY